MDKYKIKKNKQRFKTKVKGKSFWAKYSGKIQTDIKKKLKKIGFFLKLKSVKISLKTRIFKTYKEGVIRNGATIANKKRPNNSIKADKERNFRSSNTTHTYNI